MKNSKRILALLLVMLTFLMGICSASAAEIEKIHFAVLGDSIASGYGLEDPMDSYAVLIAKEKSYALTNDAVPGHTTDDLLWVLCNSTDARNSVQQAELISISICGNDLIQFLGKADTATLMDIMLNGVNAKSVRDAQEKIVFNLESICTELRLLNSTAPIIFQTQYNPLYASDQYSTYAAFAEKLVPVFEEIFNNLSSKYSNVFIADVHSAFDTYYKESGKYDIIHADGIHPNEAGHQLIAQVLLEKIAELEKAGLVPVAAKQYYLLGDADGNQKVNISDATTIQKILAGLLNMEGELGRLSIDADGSGSVNIKDATEIQKHLADLPANKSIGTYMPYYG